MTENEHGTGNGWPEPVQDAPEGYGGWQPVPHGGEYDAEATAFVQLPPEDGTDAPLAAPGHGYVPPMITPLRPDPSVAGSWASHGSQEPAGDTHPAPGFPDPYDPYGNQNFDPRATHPHDPEQGTSGMPGPAAHAPTHDQQDTSQWDFGAIDPVTPEDTPAEGTGQWRIPLATGETTDESGEYSAALYASPWNGSNPPPTLPGGARAPWATDPEPGPVHGPHAPEDVQHGWAPTAEALGVAQQPSEAPVETADAEVHEALLADPHGTSEADPHETHAVDEYGTHPEHPHGSIDAVGEPAPASEQPPVSPEPVSEEAVFPEPGSPEAALDAFAPPVPEAPEPVAEHTEPLPVDTPLSSSSGSAEHPGCSYVLRVNGSNRPVTDAWIGESLLYVLRERLGLAGAKDGCSQGECGACNVQVDGRLVASCLVPAATAAGSEVRTVEGLATDGEPSDVQRALAARGAVQCGFCIPGMAMTVHDLLEGNHAPSELETRQALSGNLCRCSGYRGVLEAVGEVVNGRVASAEAAAAAAEEARIPHQAPPGAGGAQLPHANDGGMA